MRRQLESAVRRSVTLALAAALLILSPGLEPCRAFAQVLVGNAGAPVAPGRIALIAPQGPGSLPGGYAGQAGSLAGNLQGRTRARLRRPQMRLNPSLALPLFRGGKGGVGPAVSDQPNAQSVALSLGTKVQTLQMDLGNLAARPVEAGADALQKFWDRLRSPLDGVRLRAGNGVAPSRPLGGQDGHKANPEQPQLPTEVLKSVMAEDAKWHAPYAPDRYYRNILSVERNKNGFLRIQVASFPTSIAGPVLGGKPYDVEIYYYKDGSVIRAEKVQSHGPQKISSELRGRAVKVISSGPGPTSAPATVDRGKTLPRRGAFNGVVGRSPAADLRIRGLLMAAAQGLLGAAISYSFPAEDIIRILLVCVFSQIGNAVMVLSAGVVCEDFFKTSDNMTFWGMGLGSLIGLMAGGVGGWHLASAILAAHHFSSAAVAIALGAVGALGGYSGYLISTGKVFDQPILGRWW